MFSLVFSVLYRCRSRSLYCPLLFYGVARALSQTFNQTIVSQTHGVCDDELASSCYSLMAIAHFISRLAPTGWEQSIERNFASNAATIACQETIEPFTSSTCLTFPILYVEALTECWAQFSAALRVGCFVLKKKKNRK